MRSLFALAFLSSAVFAGNSFEVARWGKDVSEKTEDTVVVWNYVNDGQHIADVVIYNRYSMYYGGDVINGLFLRSWDVAEGHFYVTTNPSSKAPKEEPDVFQVVAPKACMVEPPSLMIEDGKTGKFEVWCEGAMS